MPDNELTAERLRDLVAGAGSTIAGVDCLSYALIDAASQIIALIEREARMREALETIAVNCEGQHAAWIDDGCCSADAIRFVDEIGGDARAPLQTQGDR